MNESPPRRTPTDGRLLIQSNRLQWRSHRLLHRSRQADKTRTRYGGDSDASSCSRQEWYRTTRGGAVPANPPWQPVRIKGPNSTGRHLSGELRHALSLLDGDLPFAACSGRVLASPASCSVASMTCPMPPGVDGAESLPSASLSSGSRLAFSKAYHRRLIVPDAARWTPPDPLHLR